MYPTFNKVLESVSSKIAPDEDAFIVDSIPVEICRFARAKRAKICKEHFETSPEFGYCAAQRTTFFGYKLHALCGINGVFRNVKETLDLFNYKILCVISLCVNVIMPNCLSVSLQE